MSFNRHWRSLLTCIVLALTGVSCAIKEGPGPEKKRTIKDGDGCLQDFRLQMERYFDGQLQDAQIDALGRCVNEAITRFQAVVRGKTVHTFTATEVRDFLQYYYLDDFVITDVLLAEVMRLKRAFLGGGLDRFTADDLNYGKEVITTMADQMKTLRPFMPLTTDHLEKAPVSDLERAIVAMRSVATSFNAKILARQTGYSLKDLDRFFDELQKAFPSVKGISQARSKIPLIAAMKAAFLGPTNTPDEISGADWKVLLQDGVEWVAAYFRLKNLSGNSSEYPELLRGEGRKRLAFITNEIFDVMSRIPARHPDGVLPFQILFSVIDESGWDGSVMGTKFSLKTIKAELIPLFQRLLGGDDFGPTGRAAKGVTAVALERARVAFNEWNEGARTIEGIYQKLSGNPVFSKLAAYSPQELASVSAVEALRQTGPVTPFSERVALDLLRVVANPKNPERHPLVGPSFYLDESGRVNFDYDMLERPRSYLDLMNYAWIRPVFRLVMRGYIGKNQSEVARRTVDLARSGLKEPEFVRLIADFWPALVDFKFIGTKNSPTYDGGKRFMEANLFGFAANGDDEIDMNEGAHLLLFLISTNSISDDFIELAQKVCPTGKEDEFGVKIIEPICFREKMLDLDPLSSVAKDLYAAFPNLTKAYSEMTPQERRAFIKKLEVPITTLEALAYFPDAADNEYFDSTEIDAYIMMLHYVESMFMRFDTQGRRGVINFKEGMDAFKVFRRTLGKFAEIDPHTKKLRAVFTWLLTRGRPPGKGDLDNLAWLWLIKGGKTDVSADRAKVVNIFGTITSMAGDGMKDALKADKKVHAQDPWNDYFPNWNPQMRLTGE